jgi:hypothetical protein
MTDRLHAAAERALDALNDLIRNTFDPGTEALGARYELAAALTHTTAEVRDAARQAAGQPAAECVCEHPKSLHSWLGCNGHWGPEDGCGCTWNEHVDATPAVGGQDAGQPAEARPPQHRWRVLRKDGSDWTRWGFTYSDPQHAAYALVQRRERHPEDECHIVRETTTWTVEEDA